MSIPQMEIIATAITLIALRKRVYYVITGAILAVVGYILSLFTIVYMTLPMGTTNLVPVLWGNAMEMLKALPGSMYFYIGMFLCTVLLSLFLENTFYTKMWLPAAVGSLLYSGYYIVVNGFDIPNLFLQSPDVLLLPAVAVVLNLVCGMLSQTHTEDEKPVDNLQRV